jgi:CHASE2 domain-containing sensor protein
MKSIYKNKGIKVGILASILIIVLTYSGLFANLLKHLEYWALDYRFRLASKGGDTSEIVIIAIDDESVQKLGRWPWPRSYHARLINILHQAKAKVIGMDIIFSSPDPKQDYQLAEAIKDAQNVVMVAYPLMPTQMSFARNIMTINQIQYPIEKMVQAARGVGHIAVVYDNDGTVRRIPALLRTKDETLLAFGIEIALVYQGEDHRRIGLDRDLLRVSSIKIPIDSKGNMLINYTGGPHSFTEIPYYRVINGEVPMDFFKDKIVLVGLTAGGLSDSWVTPFINQGSMSGIELHANIINTIVDKGFFIHLDGGQNAFLILFWGILSGFVFHRFPRSATVFLIVMVSLICSVSLYLFLKKRILLETIPLLSVLFATYIPITLMKSKEYKMEVLKRNSEMSAVFKIGEVIKDSKGNIGEFLESVCNLIKNLAKADVCYSMVNMEDKNIIIDRRDQKISGHLVNPVGISYGVNQEMVQKVIRTGKPVLTDKDPKTSRTTGAMCVPIKSINDIYGVLFLERKGSFENSDLQLVSIFTDYIAFVLEKNNMLQKTKEAYIQAIQALVNVIELKYPYIHGYACQVSKLAEKIAIILNIPKDEIEVIRYAAILHDLGMTGIPEDILHKAEPLTTEQRLYLESHPDMTIELIRPLSFLKTAIPIIRHHHERYDGKGYPDGLAGDEIPLGSQILAVADSFVSMLSDRPYRKARGQEEAISELKRQAGSQFNHKVVGALIESLKEVESNDKKDRT